MSQFGNTQEEVGGEFMVQDHDHLSSNQQANSTRGNSRGVARQADQSQSRGRQQGHDDQHASAQQGGERHRKSR